MDELPLEISSYEPRSYSLASWVALAIILVLPRATRWVVGRSLGHPSAFQVSRHVRTTMRYGQQ